MDVDLHQFTSLVHVMFDVNELSLSHLGWSCHPNLYGEVLVYLVYVWHLDVYMIEKS